MKMIARVRVVVDVPFTADVDALPAYPAPAKGRRLTDLNDEEQKALAKERAAHGKQAAAVARARQAAAKQAEELAAKLKVTTGSIVEAYVEEVREA
jgi:hypothetical protein